MLKVLIEPDYAKGARNHRVVKTRSYILNECSTEPDSRFHFTGEKRGMGTNQDIDHLPYECENDRDKPRDAGSAALSTNTGSAG